uniref:Putative portal protein n=1 Tax=viral metagenome TaxID=1070528 RepID=A0A6H1ZGK0_9ZZZZ
MAKAKSKEKLRGVDQIGRKIDPKAQKALDLKGQTHNYASNKELAKRAAKHVADFISASEMNRTVLNDKLAVLYSLWNGSPVSSYFPNARTVHVPEPYKAVEGFVPRIVKILFGNPGWFRVIGVDDSGRDNIKTISRLLEAQLRADGFYQKIATFMRDCAIYGFCPGKVRWRKRRRAIRYNTVKKTPQMENGIETGKMIESVVDKEDEINQDGPTLEHIDVLDFHVDLRYRDIQGDSPGFAMRQERSEEEMLQLRDSGDYANVDDLISLEGPPSSDSVVVGPPGTVLNPATFKQLRDASDGIQTDMNISTERARTYEVFEFWGKWDKDYDPPSGQGEEKEFCITIARRMTTRANQGGGWVALRVAENEYWHGLRPAVVAHYTRRSHCFQSMGMIEPIVRLCAELDDARSMGLAALSLTAKPIVVVTDDADIFSNNLILDPGTVLHARTKDAISTLFLPDRTDSAYRSQEVMKQDIRETTGIISHFQGASDGSSETATSVSNRVQEANKRLAEVARNVAEHFVVPMLEMFHAMNQQMITDERMVELIGEDGLLTDIQALSPAQVAGKVRFEIVALPKIEMAGIEAREILAFLNIVVPLLQFNPEIARIDKLLQMAWVKMFGIASLDEIFPSAQEPLKYRSAEDEHYMFAMGHAPKVQPGENLMMHLQKHRAFMTTSVYRDWDEDAKRRLYAHAEETALKFQELQEQQGPRTPEEAMQRQMALMQQGGQEGQPGGQPGGPGGGGPAAPGGQKQTQPARPRQVGAGPGGPRGTMESAVRSAAASRAPKGPSTGTPKKEE